MTTLTIDNGVELSKTHFENIEELYLLLQQQLKFEMHLQNQAEKGMNIDTNDLLDI